MKLSLRKIVSLIVTVSMLLTLMPAFLSSPASAADTTITITNSMVAIDIQSSIQGAISGVVSGDTVTIIGEKTGEVEIITLNIPAGVTVVWKATSEDLSFIIDGGGTFDVADGGKIDVSGFGCTAIHADNGNVIVSGGTVLATGDWCQAIAVFTGDVMVTGGTVSASMTYMDFGQVCYAICLGVYDSGTGGTVTITGGKVSASSTYKVGYAISLQHGGLAAYLESTCDGAFEVWDFFEKGVIVEVESLDIPSSYAGTTSGLTHKEGDLLSNVKWDFSGTNPAINYDTGKYKVEWKAPEVPPPPPVDKPVRINGVLYETLEAAVSDANGMVSATIEVIGDVTETKSPIIVTSDITIIGVEGVHTVSDGNIVVESGGSLTLGDGTEANVLTFSHPVSVTDGQIAVKTGVILNSGLSMSGTTATGYISGGEFNGVTALELKRGATLSEISGGIFRGKQDVVYLTDDKDDMRGTKIDLISGGAFYQIDPDITLHGHAIFVQDAASIGEISGGYFYAERNCALMLIRGGWVGEISGGEFVAVRPGTTRLPSDDQWNSVVHVETRASEGYPLTGIGTISGGWFHGGAHFGMLLITQGGGTARVEEITGGLFEGVVGVQVDVGGQIGTISGGKMIANQGMLNVGMIDKICGDVEFIGTNTYGIFNYYTDDQLYGVINEICGDVIISGSEQAIANAGVINTISGGTIISNRRSGITNRGIINTISGGTIIGERSAIECYVLGVSWGGVLGTVSGGVFWGKGNVAISLEKALKLEPGLNANMGNGRYQSGIEQIFNDESLVLYPTGYKMSGVSQTVPVTGVNDVEFRYLTQDGTSVIVDPEYFYVTYNGNGFTEGSVPVDSKNPYVEDSQVTVLGQGSLTKTDHVFLGWSTNPSATKATYIAGSTFTITNDVALYAIWEKDTYTVTYAPGAHGTFTAKTTSGLQYGDPTPTPPTVTGEVGWQFTEWNPTPTTTVTGDITYIAQWTQTTTTPPTPTPPTTSPTPTLTPPTPPSTTAPTPTPPIATTTTPPTPTIPPFPPVDGEGKWALVNLILSVIGIILAVITTIRALLLKKKKGDERVDENKDRQKNTQNQQQQYKVEQKGQGEQEKYLQRRTVWLIVAIALSIVSIVVFLVTEDMSLSRTLVDKWTIVNAVLLIAEIIFIMLIFHNKKAETNNNTGKKTAQTNYP